MAERTIATVLKTVEPHGSGGSNPPPSATNSSWLWGLLLVSQSRMRDRRSVNQSSADSEASEVSCRTVSPLDPAAG